MACKARQPMASSGTCASSVPQTGDPGLCRESPRQGRAGGHRLPLPVLDAQRQVLGCTSYHDIVGD